MGFFIVLVILYAPFLGHYYSRRGVLTSQATLDHLPALRLPKMFGIQVLPIYPFLLVGVVWVGGRHSPTAAAFVSEAWQSSFDTKLTYGLWGATFLVELIIVTIWYLTGPFRRTECYALLYRWVQAKKEKLCPLVEIVE